MNAVWEIISLHWSSAIEIILMAMMLYGIYRALRRTAGARVLVGLGIVFLTLITIVHFLHLQVLAWILRSLAVLFAFLLVVVFQPELRRTFLKIGSHRFWRGDEGGRELVEEMAVAAFALSAKKMGALIAIERNISLTQWLETGVALDALFSSELALTVFFPNTVLHDGAMVVRDGRIAATACIFPLTQREDIDRNLGLRHRAALGLAEECDAVAIIVSEETGYVSLAHKGKFERNLNAASFRENLTRLLLNENPDKSDS